MTEYEMASLTIDLSDALNGIVANFVTIVSLYLGAGFVVAHRLNIWMALVITTVFLLWALLTTASMLRGIGYIEAVSGQIRELAQQGKGLAWHPMVKAPLNYEWAAQTQGGLFVFIIILAMVFFFYSRHFQRHAAAPAQ